MVSKIINLSPDALLAQATCAILIEGENQGTAWLVSTNGHLITAGHLLGIESPLDQVTVAFTEGIRREAKLIQWGYDKEKGIDFAVLKLENPIPDRFPLPIALKKEVVGKFNLRGYGKSLRDQSVGRGEILGSYFPMDTSKNRLFELRSPELGEGGYSGAAVYSDELNVVVAVQIEATTTIAGAGRDTILAMPLYRIAHYWKELLDFEKESKILYPPDVFATRSLLAPLPLPSTFAHSQPPHKHWTNRTDEIKTLTDLWNTRKWKVVSLIGLGGVGKSSLVRRWYDQLPNQNIEPDGFFWWSFYYQPSLDEFLAAVLGYLTGNKFQATAVPSPWAKVQQFVALLGMGRFLIVLDGLEVMQKTEETGDDFGRLEDRAFRNLLELCADPMLHHSFIIITSRFPVTDLQPLDGISYQGLDVDHFSDIDGAEYLKRRGIKGEETELRSLSIEYGGHALSLSLLAGYLDEYFDGQAQKANKIPFLATKEKTKVNQILQAYSNRLTEAQAGFLQLLSTFRRPITHEIIETVVYNPEFAKNNPLLKSLSSLDSFDLRELINNLQKRGLITREQNDLGEWHYTTHLLIREYFYKQLASDPTLVRQVNLKLRDYASSLSIPDVPARLEEWMPLFDVIYYSCQAGLFDEAVQLYQSRRNESGQFEFITRFGVYEFQISLLREFFPDRDLSKSPLVTDPKAKSFILIEIAYCLKKPGNTAEAKSVYRRATEAALEVSDYTSAAVASDELAELEADTGNLDNAEVIATQAIEFARLSQSKPWECNSLAALAWIFFLKGETDKAEQTYQESISIRWSDDPEEWDLFAALGALYATYLLTTGRIELSLQKTKKNMRWCEARGYREPIAFCERLLGDIAFVEGDLDQATQHYTQALELARNFGLLEELWRILVGVSKIAMVNGNFGEARANLISALEIATKSHYLVAQVDIHNCWAELHLAQNYFPLSEEQARKALETAEAINYVWGKGTSLHILGQSALLLNNQDKAKILLTDAYTIRKRIQDPRLELTQKLLMQLEQDV